MKKSKKGRKRRKKQKRQKRQKRRKKTRKQRGGGWVQVSSRYSIPRHTIQEQAAILNNAAQLKQRVQISGNFFGRTWLSPVFEGVIPRDGVKILDVRHPSVVEFMTWRLANKNTDIDDLLVTRARQLRRLRALDVIFIPGWAVGVHLYPLSIKVWEEQKKPPKSAMKTSGKRPKKQPPADDGGGNNSEDWNEQHLPLFYNIKGGRKRRKKRAKNEEGANVDAAAVNKYNTLKN